MDSWIEQHQGKAYDENGNWASEGQLDQVTLTSWLQDSYYELTPPKSTGKEHFTLERLQPNPEAITAAPADIQRTLCELTAITITESLARHYPDTDEIYVCGGGAYNRLLMKRINSLAKLPTQSTEVLGTPPEWVEALGFAWLAKSCLEGTALDTRAITGATNTCLLGAIHPGKHKP
ncbi:MAG: hypothetical protein CSA49_06115 [Gammaproteobacteria bacterium]|nr:MAG: hypothetical protein CSA49_06115 [Gammaproteobacteria bacterium]